MTVTYPHDRPLPLAERPEEVREETFVPVYARNRSMRGRKGGLKTWMILAPIGVLALGAGAAAMVMGGGDDVAPAPLVEPAATAPVAPPQALTIEPAPVEPAAAPVVEAAPTPAPVARRTTPAPAPARRAAAPRTAAPAPAPAARVEAPAEPTAPRPYTATLNAAPTPAPTPPPVIVIQPAN